MVPGTEPGAEPQRLSKEPRIVLLVLVGAPDPLCPVDLTLEVLAAPDDTATHSDNNNEKNQEFHNILLRLTATLPDRFSATGRDPVLVHRGFTVQAPHSQGDERHGHEGQHSEGIGAKSPHDA